MIILRDLNADTLNADEMTAYQELIREMPESSVLIIYLPTIIFDKKRMSAKWKSFFATDANIVYLFRAMDSPAKAFISFCSVFEPLKLTVIFTPLLSNLFDRLLYQLAADIKHMFTAYFCYIQPVLLHSYLLRT